VSTLTQGLRYRAACDGTIDDPYDLPFPAKWGLKCTPRDTSNFEWPYLHNGSSDPLHVSFCGRFSGSANRMALFPVRTNSRWRPAAILEYSNAHISGTGDPIHFMFGSRVWFSLSEDQMTLFQVRSNSRWQPAAILENYSGIARFPATARPSCCCFDECNKAGSPFIL